MRVAWYTVFTNAETPKIIMARVWMHWFSDINAIHTNVTKLHLLFQKKGESRCTSFSGYS